MVYVHDCERAGMSAYLIMWTRNSGSTWQCAFVGTLQWLYSIYITVIAIQHKSCYNLIFCRLFFNWSLKYCTDVTFSLHTYAMPLFFLPVFVSLPPFFSYRHFRSHRNPVSYLIILSHYFSFMPTRHLFAFFCILFISFFQVQSWRQCTAVLSIRNWWDHEPLHFWFYRAITTSILLYYIQY